MGFASSGADRNSEASVEEFRRAAREIANRSELKIVERISPKNEIFFIDFRLTKIPSKLNKS